MKELKFRAWHEVYEEYYKVGKIDWDNGFVFLHSEHDSGGYGFNYVTLEQYTGLNDVNGTEIYEGDVFKIKHGYNWKKESYFEVAFSRSFGYILRNENGDWFPLKAKAKEYEVIGNIHENRELLD